jgi:hypothetical protein
MNPSTGDVSGTPTVAGAYTFAVTAHDPSGDFVPWDETINIVAPPGVPHVSFTSKAPPAGVVGDPYSFKYAASGDSGISFALVSGTPPDGLTLSNDGTLSGTPQKSGSWTVTVKATGASGANAREVDTITISPPNVPHAQAAPSAIAFGDVQLGTISESKTAGISNTGDLPITVSAVKISGGDADDFSVLSDGCTDRTIQPKAFCLVIVGARPSALGVRSSTLAFEDNAFESPQKVALVTTGIPAGVAASPPPTVASVTYNRSGTISVVLIPTQPGTATVTITVPAAALAAARKGCGHGQIRTGRRCTPATVTVGIAQATGHKGVPLKLRIAPTGRIAAALRHGRTIHAILTIRFKPAGGGKPSVTRRHITLR